VIVYNSQGLYKQWNLVPLEIDGLLLARPLHQPAAIMPTLRTASSALRWRSARRRARQRQPPSSRACFPETQTWRRSNKPLGGSAVK